MSDTRGKENSHNGADPELFFVEENSQYKLSFSFVNNKIGCLAQFEILLSEAELNDISTLADRIGPGSKALLTPPDLIGFLQQNKIKETIDYPAVYLFCAAIDMGIEPEPAILARGIEPVAGANGWFELTVKISGEETEFKEDEEGHIDLRNLNAYSEIEVGQKLGVVHSPKDGVTGMNVFGLPVAAERGKPFKLLAGEGVTLKYDNRAAFAQKSGRAIFEKQTLSVVDQLIIPGDVDLSVGNINFNGFVDIKGDVPDAFDVRSTKGIKIAGAVGACHIESSGSVEIFSMAGKEIGQIICHGDLYVNYLNQVKVQCYGDVYVTRELRNSQVKSTGKIIVEQGAIIGGQCTAMEGIEAKILGTSSGQKTELVAGVYFPDTDRFDYLHDQLRSVVRQIKAINNALEPLNRLLLKKQGNSNTVRLRLTVLKEKLLRLHQEKNRFQAEIEASRPQKFSTKNPKINVTKKIMEGVCMTLGKVTAENKIERTGAISIIENTRDGELRYLPLSPIRVMANNIEAEIFAESDAESDG
ncbi:hypothetical protein SAMN05660420_02390 [Desulfuromusa kysingii]|uniref:Flagellar Assembly Protein A N-terminal region domain-containing protein n=1 Tax=Desulfuromusa kysingii TaxID=37625 RepID=A0A1H4C231_9BACT|nr:FapA family protein [Desulfuromusa kysingii]SEA54390.1 hypothetical protein SAMN05660420_02390 [Desulfuromusa kysingii]